ncbi:glycosyltransferase [Nocardioides marmotae]|uniref:glycosyltransferase n=1 Tax=Nocardioides marmotae TaxID=2663857 RepID=UPI0016591DE3|nr:glycosyltransferase [Nocardioides marmotae]MBC9735316.1 glycosyltransferase [Nocardioides marmotae]
MGVLDSLERGLRALWVVSPGGHLEEAIRLDRLLQTSADSIWITARTAQAESLLKERQAIFTDYVQPRDMRGSLRVARTVIGRLDLSNYDVCISTGAAMAAAPMLFASHRGLLTVFVESLARTDGPSVTGRIVKLDRRIQLLTQHREWADRRWRYEGSLLDSFVASELAPMQDDGLSILVTLGTIRPYRFDRLIDQVLISTKPADRVFWQVGASARDDLPGDVYEELPAHELADIAGAVDVIVSHAGVGSTLLALGAGKSPLIAPRSRKYREHVDDHQEQIARDVSRRGLADMLALDRDARGGRQALLRAARRRVMSV